MAKINFIVKSKQPGQPATIYLRYSGTRGTDFVAATREKVFPEYWSFDTQEFKQKIIFNNQFTEQQKVDIENRLTDIRAMINKEYFLLKGKPVTGQWIKLVLDKFYSIAPPDKETLNQYIKRFIDELTSGKRDIEGKRYEYSTIKNYRGLETQLNEFQGIYTEKRLKELKENNERPRPVRILDFEDINIDFYSEFLKFFIDKNYSPNTIGRHIKQLKVVMRAAMEEGKHNNPEFERKAFKSLTAKVANVYLSENELKAIFDLDLSDNKPMELARDVFLVGCYCAQRYSDYSRINKTQVREIRGGKVIELIQQKTRETVIIPVRTELDIILRKYDYTLPRTHEQKVNKYIKEIGKLAGINSIINFEESRGGLRVKKSVPKHELIKTHTARRSGCTNMYLAGIPIISIMKISGHLAERQLLAYIKITKQETAEILLSHPYFAGSPLKVAK